MPYLNDDVMDVLLQYVADNGDQLSLCDTIPTTYTEAITTYKLAIITGLTSGDYSLGAGAVSGRSLTMSAQTGITVDVEGIPLYAAITDSGGTALLAYFTCTSDTIYVGQTVNTTSAKINVLDPT
jgi:hypothetical protein